MTILDCLLAGYYLFLQYLGVEHPITALLLASVFILPGFLVLSSTRFSEYPVIIRLFHVFLVNLCLDLAVTFFIILLSLSREPLSFLVFLSLLSKIVMCCLSHFYPSQGSSSGSRTLSPKRSQSKFLWLLPVFVFLLAGVILYFMMLNIPFLFDHETYVIGGAYGLMEKMVPVMWPALPDETFQITNLSKPPLSFFYTAWSLLLTGTLEDVELFYRATAMPPENRPEASDYWVEGVKTEFPQEEIINARGGDGKGVRLYILPGISVPRPVIHAGRIPHVTFFLLSAVILFLFLRERGLHLSWQIGAVCLYLSLPEVMMRSCVASTEPLTSFLYLLLLCFFFDESEETTLRQVSMLIVSCLVFWAHHKTMVFALGLIAWHMAREDGWKDYLSDSIISGFVLGFVSFSIYSILSDPGEFLHAFLSQQNVGRLFFFQILPPEDRIYPDVVNVWMQFNRFTGSLFLIFGLMSLSLLLKRYREKAGIFIFWFVVTFFLGSLTDHRMTRHLTVGILPLLLPAVMLADQLKGKWPILGWIITISIILKNILLHSFIMNNFLLVSPLPAW